MIISLEKKEGIKLKTAQTVVREDISVIPKLQSKSISMNGEYTPDEGYCGFKKVVVNVDGESAWCGKYDDGTTYYVGSLVYYQGSIYRCKKMTDEGKVPTDTDYWDHLITVANGTKEIHANGTHDVTEYASVKVLVPDENSWCGEYDSSVNYKENAIVIYGANVYLCIKDIDDQQPPTNEEYWEVIYEIKEFNGAEITLEPLTRINFNITKEYAALSGMTWGEWINSEYNTENFGAYNGQYVIFDTTADTLSFVTLDGEDVMTNEEIIADANYSVRAGAEMIDFTVDGVAYRAESGMTWGSFCGTSWNTDSFVATSENILVDENKVVVFLGVVEPPEATIVDGRVYYTIEAN